MKPLIVQLTIGKHEEATRLATLLVEEGLAACVQVIPGIESTYRWKGKVAREVEYQLSIKSSESHWDSLVAFLKKNHPYECPEIVGTIPSHVEADYLSWWKNSLKKDS